MPAMKPLREADSDSVVIPDHIPSFVSGHYDGVAHNVASMKALLERSNQEVGSQLLPFDA